MNRLTCKPSVSFMACLKVSQSESPLSSDVNKFPAAVSSSTRRRRSITLRHGDNNIEDVDLVYCASEKCQDTSECFRPTV